jgi:hypothetical protein
MSLQKPYCTLLDVQAETKSSDSELTSVYEACINRASRYIDRHCKRDFWFHDYTSTAFVVPRRYVLGNELILPYPILSLTELRFFPDASEESTSDYALEEIDYYFEAGKHTVAISSIHSVEYPFEGRMELFGTFGYELTVDGELAPPMDIPASVRRACTILAAAWSNERRVEQVSLDGSKASLIDSSVPQEVITLLDCFVMRIGMNF